MEKPALTPRRAAMASINASSAADSQLKLWIPLASANSTSAARDIGERSLLAIIIVVRIGEHVWVEALVWHAANRSQPRVSWPARRRAVSPRRPPCPAIPSRASWYETGG